tara:strand:+ start:983 stop:1309 length:327 start_codon:yes stop_codon:yes gene_type:complete
LQEGELKQCPKCKELKQTRDFEDSSLRTGIGRFCSDCKSARVSTKSNTKSLSTRISNNKVRKDVLCSVCKAKMILRIYDPKKHKSKFDPFYGCSRFPQCNNAYRITSK